MATLFEHGPKTPAPSNALRPGWTLYNVTESDDLNAIDGAIMGMRVSLMDPAYGATGDGVADDTTAVLAALAAASAAGACRHLFIPPGFTFKVSKGAISSGSGRITIPSNFTVSGAGPHSKIKFTGVDAAAEGLGFVYDLFRVAAGSSNIVFRDFMIVGENSPFAYYSQNQSAAIGIENGSTTSDVAVRNVWFQNLYGFSVHAPGEDSRIHVTDCHVKDCSNGINVNANYSIQRGNSIENSEGIEFSGKYSLCVGNIIRNARGSGISAGGNTGVGAKYPGQVVANNIIDGAVDGTGIAVAEASVDCVVSCNTVRRCDNGGINITATAGTRRGVAVVGNVISSNCKSGGGSLVGLVVQGTGKHHVSGNICRDEGETGFAQQYGCAVYAPNCSFSGNFFSGTGTDIEFQSTATGTLYDSSNHHENGNVSIVAGATFAVFGIGLESSDSSGSPGDATINKPSGRSKTAAAAGSITITNSLVLSASTKVWISLVTTDVAGGAANAYNVTASPGQFIVSWFNVPDAQVTFDWRLEYPT